MLCVIDNNAELVSWWVFFTVSSLICSHFQIIKQGGRHVVSNQSESWKQMITNRHASVEICVFHHWQDNYICKKDVLLQKQQTVCATHVFLLCTLFIPVGDIGNATCNTPSKAILLLYDKGLMRARWLLWYLLLFWAHVALVYKAVRRGRWVINGWTIYIV